MSGSMKYPPQQLFQDSPEPQSVTKVLGFEACYRASAQPTELEQFFIAALESQGCQIIHDETSVVWRESSSYGPTHRARC